MKTIAFKAKSRFRMIVALGALVILCATNASAHSAGWTGVTTSGCTCHNPNSSSATTVSVVSGSGSFLVAPQSTTTFTITVAHSTESAAGVDIGMHSDAAGSSNAGTLAPVSGSGLQAASSELTHTGPKNMTSGAASFAFTWAAPVTPGTYYMHAAGNAVNLSNDNTGDAWNFLPSTTVTVTGIVVNSPNTGVTWCAGTSQAITWTSGGVTGVNIDLSSDGGTTYPTRLATGVTASLGTWSWSIPSGQTSGTQYRIRVSDGAGVISSDASDANFTINATPSISSHPSGSTLCAGGQVTLSVTASGLNDTYQWRKGGNAIPNATSSTYIINPVTASSAGSYDVVVTNGCGSATSNPATLTVNTPPSVSTHPASVIRCLNDTATIVVVATGTNLTYQWRKGGAPINGATNATLSFANLTANDAGNYDVVISGTCSPPATSNIGTLTVNTAPVVTTDPSNATKCFGQSVSFTVAATGGNLTYQWRKNGNPIVNAIASTYTINSVSGPDAGAYDVIVSGLCAPAATSRAATLTVNLPPTITVHPQDAEVCPGQPVTLRVTASGTNLTYQWRKKGAPIGGATGTTYNIAALAEVDTGSYDVVVSGVCLPAATSNAAYVGLFDSPSVTTHPASQTVTAGQNVVFTVDATGRDLRYQWRKNNVDRPNDTLSTLTMNNVKVSDAGAYTCRVYNQCASSVSNAAQLTVNPAGSGPFLSPSVALIDFGPVRPNEQRDSTFTGFLKNIGDAPLIVTAMSISGAGAPAFSITQGGTVPFTLAPNDTRTITLRFTSPNSVGLSTAILGFTSNSISSSTVTLNAETAQPGMTTSANAGRANVGASADTAVRLCNTGRVPITVTKLTMSQGAFSVTGSTPTLPAVLLPDSCMLVTIHFAPTQSGPASGTLTVEGGTPAETFTVAVTGTGVPTGGVLEDVSLVERMNIVPNPMRDRVEISLLTRDGRMLELMIVDMNGRTVKEYGRINTAIVQKLTWDGKDGQGRPCPGGVYRVVARQGDRQRSVSLVLGR